MLTPVLAEGQLSEVVELNDVSYKLSEFTKAPHVESPKAGFSSGKTVEISENVQRVQDLDKELPQSVLAWTKRVIAQGCDPDDPTRFAKEGTTEVDRSKALFSVVCELVRNQVPDDVIYAIITDPDWAISESVIDGSNGLKNDVENAFGVYVSNGAFIAAAHRMGSNYRVQGPNVVLTLDT